MKHFLYWSAQWNDTTDLINRTRLIPGHVFSALLLTFSANVLRSLFVYFLQKKKNSIPKELKFIEIFLFSENACW